MRIILTAALLAVALPCAAQDHSTHPGGASAPSTAGYSAEERAAGLREGRGMGLAMPAEGNGYPGPRHVLELADQLGLSPHQRRRTEALFAEMLANAGRLGSQLLAEEAALEALFRERRATPRLLEAATRRIGETEAALKLTHLRTHLVMMEVLSPEQVARYVALRRSGAGSGRTRPQAAAAEHRGH